MVDEKLVRVASGARKGIYYSYLVLGTAQKGDFISASRTTTYCIGFVARISPAEEFKTFGLAIDLMLDLAREKEGGLPSNPDKQFMVELEATIAEMMVLFIPIGRKYPQHARLAFKPPKVKSLVSCWQHERLYDYGRRCFVEQ